MLGVSVLLTVVFTGCEKSLLTVDRHGSSVQPDLYYTTVQQCNTSTQVCYRYIDWDSWWQTFNWRYLSGEAASDNAWIGNTYQSSHSTYDVVSQYTIDAGNDRNESQWIQLYKGIGIFNSAIEGISGSPIDTADKQRFTGELKFLRAWCYFDLVRNYGGVPLVLKTYLPDTHLPRNTVKEVYDQLIADLKEAAAVLPLKSAYAPADKFRASKGAALALLAKIYLYAEDWADAETAAKQVMDMGDYHLENDFGDLWDYHYKNGAESIFEIQTASSQNPPLPSSPLYMMNSVADAGWGYYSVTSDLENAYLSEKDSIRRVWTINKQGEPVAGDPDNKSFDGRGYVPGGPSPASKSGRFCRKWYVPKAERPSNGLYSRDDIILRLADVILIHAEACAMQQKTAEALASLKMIRDRVQLPTDMSLSGWDLINAVRKERRLEMAFEGDRLYDLRRWKDPAGKRVIEDIFGPNGSFVLYNTKTSKDVFETNNTLEPQNKGIHFNPAVHLLWPIPNSEIVASGGVVEQNPGY
ncbi:RagB/SusD family nutrient uptake outer membrane protein [Compostibacter hankyongensis]|uniref:RagB/SusD family nutrient uptake outer membrane protein n=2 Tax=Compostibacter hankyongensis TaxID=1007089 RepID=A0ABP8FNH0_9BACT